LTFSNAVPFLVEYKLSGSLLGLSGTPTAMTYLQHIVLEVKVGGGDLYHLYPMEPV